MFVWCFRELIYALMLPIATLLAFVVFADPTFYNTYMCIEYVVIACVFSLSIQLTRFISWLTNSRSAGVLFWVALVSGFLYKKI